MEYKGVGVFEYGSTGPIAVPAMVEFLDLAARVDALEKRLAEDEPAPCDEPDKKVIELKRRCQCGIRGWHDGFDYAVKNKSMWPLFESAVDTAPKDEPQPPPLPASEYITKERAKDLYRTWQYDTQDDRGFVYVIDTEPSADVVPRVSSDDPVNKGRGYGYLKGVAEGRRQGVEAVAKWFEQGGEARETISAGIRANLDEILKEADNAENH